MTGRIGLWLLLTVAGPLAAAPHAPAAPVLPPSASPNVELVRHVPSRHRPNGGRLVGRYFYLTTGVDLTIYDVADPENPVEVGQMYFSANPVDQIDAGDATGYQEDVDTNGRILLRSEADLEVVDVSDPRSPSIIGRLPGFGTHTITCVLDCTWAYASGGEVVDLRDPRNPRRAGRWDQHDGIDLSAHDVTEVAPGLVLTGPMDLLDARTDPTAPTLLARTDAGGAGHGSAWPKAPTGRIALSGGEMIGPNCGDSPYATLNTYDTTDWRRAEGFRLVDSYRVQRGAIVDGRNVESTWCAHWFDAHPRFGDGGGPVAMAWYEHGTRFVQVGADGRMREAGWFLRPDGYAWSAHWVGDRVVYVADNYHGIDVLRFTGDIPAAPPAAPAPQPSSRPAAPAARKAFGDLVALPSTARCAGRRGLVLRLRDPGDVRLLQARIGRRPFQPAAGRTLRLRRIPRRRFTVEAVITTADGRRLTRRAPYRPCRAR